MVVLCPKKANQWGFYTQQVRLPIVLSRYTEECVAASGRLHEKCQRNVATAGGRRLQLRVCLRGEVLPAFSGRRVSVVGGGRAAARALPPAGVVRVAQPEMGYRTAGRQRVPNVGGDVAARGGVLLLLPLEEMEEGDRGSPQQAATGRGGCVG